MTLIFRRLPRDSSISTVKSRPREKTLPVSLAVSASKEIISFSVRARGDLAQER